MDAGAGDGGAGVDLEGFLHYGYHTVHAVLMCLIHPSINSRQKPLIQILLIQPLQNIPHRIHPLPTQRHQKLPTLRFTRRLHHLLHILCPLIQILLRHAHHRLNRRHQIIRQGTQFGLLRRIRRLIRPFGNAQEETGSGNHPDGARDGIGKFVGLGVGEFGDHIVHYSEFLSGGVALHSGEAGAARWLLRVVVIGGGEAEGGGEWGGIVGVKGRGEGECRGEGCEEED
mmetsp:Transcript_5497/g.11284  ORF Transcript_5497/g.11284 Transcript_5497/m.11284 type:complete len:228 (-) Transcript_5497:136-819(-)